ncbi:putative disease resistance protein RGA1 [Humulus lupulus]|uniref:putative disease resistance protein RGA1 n=1 Tax=Humulus lupulus TaxID=3486 RepID=UPI002B404ED4|nr:putative disease resistance protein RGA1 [Humulus lupulus]
MAEYLMSRLMQQLFTSQLGGLGKDVMEDVEELSVKLAEVQAALFVADQIQFSDVSAKLWVDKVEDFYYEADSMLDEWYNTLTFKSMVEKDKGQSTTGFSLKKVCFSCIPSSTCFCLSITRNKAARKIIELNKNLDEIFSEQKQFPFERRSTEIEPRTTTLPQLEARGREKETLVLVNALLLMDETRLCIIPIVGMGGIGKTTLAQLAYDHSKVRTYFDLRIWVHVGDSFDVTVIAKNIIYSIKGIRPNLLELESLLNCIKKLVQRKRFLLVLDDVWNEDRTKWAPLEGSLNHGAWGSKVMVTTRNKKVAVMMKATTRMICLDRLCDESCWYIISNLAFSEGLSLVLDQRLEEIGKKIVKKYCKGVPLIAKAYGNLLRLKSSKEEWDDVLKCQLWELSDVRQIVVDPLLLSYYDLSPLEKCCLLYSAVFPADFEISKDDLIQLWMSQGYLGRDNKSFERGENCFKSLVMRSIFFQKIESNSFHGNATKCKMNDVIHEFVRFVRRSSMT